MLTLVSITYLSNFYPQKKYLEYSLELMNECVTMIISDLCLLFTNLDPDPYRQYNWGYVVIVATLVCIGVQVYFLFEGIVKQLIKTIKKARKKGLLKAFPILRKVKHILQVIACRRKLNIEKLRVKEESSEHSEEVKHEKPKQMSVIEESVNEDEEQPQLLLIQPPTERQQE